MSDRRLSDYELLILATTLLAEIQAWLVAQRLSEPDTGPQIPDLDLDFDADKLRETFEQQRIARAKPGVRQHFSDRSADYRERFSERMGQLHDGLVMEGIRPDVTRPKYVNGGGADGIIDTVVRDLELIVLRLEARRKGMRG